MLYHGGCIPDSVYHGGGITDLLYHGGGITILLYHRTDVLYHPHGMTDLVYHPRWYNICVIPPPWYNISVIPPGRCAASRFRVLFGRCAIGSAALFPTQGVNKVSGLGCFPADPFPRGVGTSPAVRRALRTRQSGCRARAGSAACPAHGPSARPPSRPRRAT